MKDELREVYSKLTFDDACCIIREKLENMAANYVSIGFFLRRAKEQELYRAGGYESIHDMAKTEFGMARQTTDHCMAVNRKFSKDGDSPMLAGQYHGFSKSQLQEMLYLTDEQLETVAPEMTVREIRNVRKDSEPGEEQRMNVELKKPNRGQEEYLNQFAKFFIIQNFQWMRDDHMNRAMLVDRSPEEIKTHLGNIRAWSFDVPEGVANINLFDDYVQLWDERGDCQGNFEWFYLAAAIQRMWNVVSLERAKEQQEKEKCSTSSMEQPKKEAAPTWKERCQKGECPPGIPDCIRQEWGASPEQQTAGCKECENCWTKWQRQQEILQRAESREEPPIQPENKSLGPDEKSKTVIDGEYQEVEEKAAEKYTPRYFLEEQKARLDEILAVERQEGSLPAKMLERQKIIVGALAAMVSDLELEELKEQMQAEQPELPVLKNNDQRKAWLANYKDWGLWYEDDHIGVKYYKYDFGNGARLIAEVYEHSEFCSAYLHLVGGPKAPAGSHGFGKWTRHEKYSRHPNSDTELVDFLKEIQKGG